MTTPMTDSRAPMLDVEGLVKLHAAPRGAAAGGIAAATFAVPSGAFFTLLGPSGCGKTTTLRCLAGLEIPDAGRISIAGQIAFDAQAGITIPVHRRDIGMVFQSYAIWPHMNVFDNVSFPLRVSRTRRYGRAAITERVGRVLAMVGLAGYERRPATDLSGGQQQRLALARAVIREPKLLLLDEPLSNLDAKLREEMRIELKRLQRTLGITTVYVTHDQAEALALSDQVAVLDRGHIVQIGSPDTIYNAPNSEFVASFVGSANLLRGRVVERTGPSRSLRVKLADDTIIRCPCGDALDGAHEVAVAVRPEAIRIEAVAGRAPSEDNRMLGRVTNRTFLGQCVTLEVAAAGTTVRVAVDAESTAAPGERVVLVFPVRRCIAVRPGEV
jgi:iron(III) transport system ATP-binding protein